MILGTTRGTTLRSGTTRDLLAAVGITSRGSAENAGSARCGVVDAARLVRNPSAIPSTIVAIPKMIRAIPRAIPAVVPTLRLGMVRRFIGLQVLGELRGTLHGQVGLAQGLLGHQVDLDTVNGLGALALQLQQGVHQLVVHVITLQSWCSSITRT